MEVKRPWRVAFYYVRVNNNALYMQSRIAALLIFKEWAAEAAKQEGEHVVEFGGVVKPHMQKVMSALDIVDLLNHGWDAFTVTRTTFKDGVIVKTFTDPKYKAMHNQCNKLRIKGLYFNNDLRKSVGTVCRHYTLLETCFRAPAANVFEAFVKMTPENELKDKQTIVKHAKSIFYVLRKPYRQTR